MAGSINAQFKTADGGTHYACVPYPPPYNYRFAVFNPPRLAWYPPDKDIPIPSRIHDRTYILKDVDYNSGLAYYTEDISSWETREALEEKLWKREQENRELLKKLKKISEIIEPEIGAKKE